MDYLTVKDVAALVRRNEETIRRMIRARKLDVTLDNNNRRQGYMIPVDELTRTWDISPEEVQRYIDRARAERADEPPARMPLGPERGQERDGAGQYGENAAECAPDDAGKGKDARSGDAPPDGGAERADAENTNASGAEQTCADGREGGAEPHGCAGREENVLVRGARLLAREAERLAAMAREGFMAESGGSDMNDRNDRRTGGRSGDAADAGERVSEIIGDAYRQIRRAVDQVGEACTQARSQGNRGAYGHSAVDAARRARADSQAAIRDAILRAQGAGNAQGADSPCDAQGADRHAAAHGTGGWAENIRPLSEERRQRADAVTDEVERAARDVREAAQRAARQAQQDARDCGRAAYSDMRDMSRTVSRMARDIGAGVQRAARQAYAACEEAVRDARAAADENAEHIADEREQTCGAEVQAQGAYNERAEHAADCDASRAQQPDVTRTEQADSGDARAQHAPHADREHGEWERAQPTPAPEFERFRGRQPDFTPRADIEVDARGIMCEDNNASYQMLMAARRAVEQRMRGTQQADNSQNADAHDDATHACHYDMASNASDAAACQHAQADAHTDEAECAKSDDAADNEAMAECAASDVACANVPASDIQSEPEAEQAEANQPEQEPEQPESVPQLPTSDEDAMRARINSLEAQLSRLNGQLEKLTRRLLGEDE